MTTPWINNQKMQLINSKQMNTYKSSGVKKKQFDSNFQQINEHENDTYIKKDQSVPSYNNDEILKMCYLINLLTSDSKDEKEIPESSHDFSKKSISNNGIKVDETNIVNNVFQSEELIDLKNEFQTVHKYKRKEDSQIESDIEEINNVDYPNERKSFFNELDSHFFNSVIDPNSSHSLLESTESIPKFFSEKTSVAKKEFLTDASSDHSKEIINNTDLQINTVHQNDSNIESEYHTEPAYEEETPETITKNNLGKNISDEYSVENITEDINSQNTSQSDEVNKKSNIINAEDPSILNHEVNTDNFIDNDVDPESIFLENVDSQLSSQVDEGTDEINIINTEWPSIHEVFTGNIIDNDVDPESIFLKNVDSQLSSQVDEGTDEINIINAEWPSIHEVFTGNIIAKDVDPESIFLENVDSQLASQVDEGTDEINIINAEWPSIHEVLTGNIIYNDVDPESISFENVDPQLSSQVNEGTDEINIVNSDVPSVHEVHTVNIIDNDVDPESISFENVDPELSTQVDEGTDEINIVNADVPSIHEVLTGNIIETDVDPESISFENVGSQLSTQVDEVTDEIYIVNVDVPSIHEIHTNKIIDSDVDPESIFLENVDSQLSSQVGEGTNENNIINADVTSIHEVLTGNIIETDVDSESIFLENVDSQLSSQVGEGTNENNIINADVPSIHEVLTGNIIETDVNPESVSFETVDSIKHDSMEKRTISFNKDSSNNTIAENSHNHHESIQPLKSSLGSKDDEIKKNNDDMKQNNFSDLNQALQTDNTEETNKNSHANSALENMHSSELETSIEEDINKNNLTEDSSESSKFGKICSMTIDIPFSIIAKINDFHHLPIFGTKIQSTFDFLDANNNRSPQLNTKLFNTKSFYFEHPYCHLVSSTISESIFLTKNVPVSNKNHNNNSFSANVYSLNESLSMKNDETNNRLNTSHDFIYVKVPVIVGEYEIEICLEEEVQFNEEILRIKELSKEIILTDCKFVPSQFSESIDSGICNALKGNLFLEGYMHQTIEYTAGYNINVTSNQKKSLNNSPILCQDIVASLVIQLLQVQRIRVNFNDKEI